VIVLLAGGLLGFRILPADVVDREHCHALARPSLVVSREEGVPMNTMIAIIGKGQAVCERYSALSPLPEARIVKRHTAEPKTI
jgi:hypothetical protein